MANWKPEYTLALIPILAAFLVSMLILMFGGSEATAQWAAIIVFVVALPFVIGRLIDRAR